MLKIQVYNFKEKSLLFFMEILKFFSEHNRVRVGNQGSDPSWWSRKRNIL